MSGREPRHEDLQLEQRGMNWQQLLLPLLLLLRLQMLLLWEVSRRGDAAEYLR